ncbi:MAG: adenylosuccinate synthase [Deltaproteobacteria bacterium]|nr:adenylosuccinate synthase [Deltaproteobacteria bacterium]
MPATIVLGAQWGDEGKGKVVDALASASDVVVRFQGGANAGHTVQHAGVTSILHLLPSGVLQPHTRNVIASGCVVDPFALLEEIRTLVESGTELAPGRLLVSGRCHLVTPIHRAVDQATGGAVGTTGRGIGPCHGDRILRRGLRIRDALDGFLEERLAAQIASWGAGSLGLDEPALLAAQMAPVLETLAPYVADTEAALAEALARDERVLYEGAQGALLDIDHGTYPFVTSSSTTIGGAFTGGGVWVTFERRIGVVKAYTTRVGNGPFPTEIEGPTAEFLRERGREYGATTGRPRRCGWLDLPLLAQAVRTNGYTEIALTKIDCLTGLDPVRVATGRDPDGAPVYREMEGWGSDIGEVRDWDDLPRACREYVGFIETALGVPIALLSTGPGRDQLLGSLEP